MAAVLLLNPTYQWLTWEFFHPDAVAIAPLLFAYWARARARWKWFVLFAVLAAACKEDVVLAIAVMGVLVAVRGDRKIGLLTVAASIAWYTIATRVIIPWQNGIGPFYDSFFGDLGKNPIEVGTHLVTHPRQAVELATEHDRVSYYEMMFAPVAFLPLLAIPTLLIAGPMLAVNVFSSFPYTREIRYHYSSLVLVGIILATVESDRVGRGEEAGARALPGGTGGGHVAGRDRGVGAVADRREVPLRHLAAAGRPASRRATPPSTWCPAAHRPARSTTSFPTSRTARRSTTSPCRGGT